MQPIRTVDLAVIREGLRELTNSVTIHYYTSDVESWYSYAERQLLEDIAGASQHLDLRVSVDRWDAQREAQVGIRRTPAIALYGKQDTGIRYYGMPDGYELDTFLDTLRAIASGTSSLHPDTLTRLHQLTRPLHLEVIVLPT